MRVRRRLLTLGGGVAIAGVSACVMLPAGPLQVAAAGTADCTTVYVTSNGFHTGIAIPAEAAEAAGFILGRAPWVEVGWGEARAYRAERLGVGTALAAAFVPGTTVLHLAPLPRRPDLYYEGGVTPVALSRAGLAVLARELGAEAVRGADGALTPVGPGKAPGAVFVQARSRYRPWHTCNVWTAERLRAAGVAVRPGASTFASPLTQALERRPPCVAAVDGPGTALAPAAGLGSDRRR